MWNDFLCVVNIDITYQVIDQTLTNSKSLRRVSLNQIHVPSQKGKY